MIEELDNKRVFTLHFNIESSSYSKKEVRKEINIEVALLSRKDEIARGEII